eukprot:4602340-Pyramimonas_sp.AAC.1
MSSENQAHPKKGSAKPPNSPSGGDENAGLCDRLVNFELKLRDKGLSYMWGMLFFFANVLVGISGVYHVLWKLETLGSEDNDLKCKCCRIQNCKLCFGLHTTVPTLNSLHLLPFVPKPNGEYKGTKAVYHESVNRTVLHKLAVDDYGEYFPFDELMPHFHKIIALSTAAAGLIHTVALTVVYSDEMVSWTDAIWLSEESGA